MIRILLVDDNRALLEGMAHTLADDGYSLTLSETAEAAIERLDGDEYAVVVTDLRLPGQSGIELLKQVKEKNPRTVVILITAYGSVDSAVEAMQLGAFDFVSKPFSAEELTVKVRKAVERYQMEDQIENLSRQTTLLRGEMTERFHPDGIVGKSTLMGEIRRNIEQVAVSRSAVLILGETGTGKELVARALHHRSPRADRPFVRVNCAVFNDNLLESELFGHEKGAFTGADQRRVGRFELADTGTIFLDEVGDLSMAAQAKLLRVLQEREFERVGGTDSIRVDVRVVAATNRNLGEEIRDGKFREDLFYRLSVVPIQLPPLRERKEDILPLIEHFLERYSAENHKIVKGFTADAMDQIMNYEWPGNVRELENVVERGVVLASSDMISQNALPFQADSEKAAASADLTQQVDSYERRLIAEALVSCAGNTTRAAQMLGVSRSTLRYKIDKYRL